MDKKKALILGGIGAASALGLGFLLSRIIKGSGGTFDNDDTIPGEDDIVSGSTPPGYIWDESTKMFVKVLPESEFKISRLISGYPTMSVGLEVPVSDVSSPKVFQAQFALGHWYPSVPDVFTTRRTAMCGYACPPAPQDGSCGCMGTGLDWFSRMGYPGHNDPCPICGGTGVVDITPPYPLDISAVIASVYPEFHLTNEIALAGGWNMSGRNANYKIGDGVFVPGAAVKDIVGSPWIFVGGITWQYINVSSRWFRDVNRPDIITAAEDPYGYGYQGLVRKANPVPTNYSIIDTEATNIDCGAGYYYDGKKCVQGTHPGNPYKNQKYDVCVVLFEEDENRNYHPRDYMVVVNAVTTGDAISDHDGSQAKPYEYNQGWQGQGYYQNVPGTSGAAIYVATLDDYNNLF